MSAIIAAITAIQLITAPMTHHEMNAGVEHLPRQNLTTDRNNYLQYYQPMRPVKRKTIWLEDFASIQKNNEEGNIISDWIIPVTVTAGVGVIVFAIYHYRGR